MFDIEINVDEIIQKFESMKQKAEIALLRAIYKAGLRVQAYARLLCPVDTGDLRRSIYCEMIPNGVQIGTILEYAIFVEFGTGSRGAEQNIHDDITFTLKKTGEKGVAYDYKGQSPQPFLYPAFQLVKEELMQIIEEEFKKEMARYL